MDDDVTLRDLFAGLAMMGDFASQNEVVGCFNLALTSDYELIENAKGYYKMADAMIKARQPNTNNKPACDPKTAESEKQCAQ